MERGDHLFYYRAGSTYSHHGISCGDGTVIHYESSLWMKLAGSHSQHEVPTVKRVPLAEFSLGSRVWVRPYRTSDDPELVVTRAMSRLGEADYSLFENNCEHFAVWCKTGRSHSSQIQAHREASHAVMQTGPVGLYLLRTARRIPGPYRALAVAGTAAVAGSVYLGTYLAHRQRHRDASIS